MTACKLLMLQELLNMAYFNEDATSLAAALLIVNEEVDEITFTDEQQQKIHDLKSEIHALRKEV